MAKGAAETGYVEAYMCNKISRNPIVAQSCAEFMGYFQPTDVGGTFARGSQVRRCESVWKCGKLGMCGMVGIGWCGLQHLPL